MKSNGILASAGCVHPELQPMGGIGTSASDFVVVVTPLGRTVLEVLAAYVAVRKREGASVDAWP